MNRTDALQVALVNARPLVRAGAPEVELRHALSTWRLDATESAGTAGAQVYDVKRTGPSSFHTIDPDGVQVLWLPDCRRGAVRCGASVEWAEGDSPLDLVAAWTQVTPQGS